MRDEKDIVEGGIKSTRFPFTQLLNCLTLSIMEKRGKFLPLPQYFLFFLNVVQVMEGKIGIVAL